MSLSICERTYDGNPPGVEKPEIKFFNPALSREYFGIKGESESSSQRHERIPGAPCPKEHANLSTVLLDRNVSRSLTRTDDV